MPLLRMAMYRKGSSSTARRLRTPRDTWVASMRHIALRGPLLCALGEPVRAPLETTRIDYPVDVPADESCAGGTR